MILYEPVRLPHLERREWTAEEIATLRRLWGKPGRTASQIAEELRREHGLIVSGAAVIAKAGRENFPSRRKQWSEQETARMAEMWRESTQSIEAIARQLGREFGRPVSIAALGRLAKHLRLPARRAGRKTTVRRQAPAVLPVDSRAPRWAERFPAAPGALPLTALGPRTCRWPVGAAEGAVQLFCGSAAPEGQSYCPAHQACAGAGAPAIRPPSAVQRGYLPARRKSDRCGDA